MSDAMELVNKDGQDEHLDVSMRLVFVVVVFVTSVSSYLQETRMY
jgi:hypothetical protein